MNAQSPMTARERAEHARLLTLWATRRATRAQIFKCMDYDRRAQAEKGGAA